MLPADLPNVDPALAAAAAPTDSLLPMGVWLRIGDQHYFSYLDAEAGPSIAGDIVVDAMPVHMITRVTTLGAGAHVLDEAERVAAGLPVEPKWLANYGKQPPRGSLWGAWRADPALRGRFHSAEYPDDLQVAVYRGTPTKMKGKAELVWVRVQACADGVCEGRMLNEPFHIPTLHEGDLLTFRTAVATDAILWMEPR